MTPKEKAKELVDKMYQACSVTIAGTATIFRGISKSLAIIAVDEILAEINNEWYDNPARQVDDRKMYWGSVKSEINNP